jgi:hypothetical protein
MREQGRGGGKSKTAESFAHLRATPLFVQSENMHRCFALKKRNEAIRKTDGRNNRNLALKVVRRWTREELGKPGARDSFRFENGSRTLNLNQHHHGSRNRNRSRCMHCNAQRAMIGIRVYRMHVRHLHHGKQSKQNQTNNGRHRQSTSLCAAFSARNCLKSYQYTYPCFKNTHYWTRAKPSWLWSRPVLAEIAGMHFKRRQIGAHRRQRSRTPLV